MSNDIGLYPEATKENAKKKADLAPEQVKAW